MWFNSRSEKGENTRKSGARTVPSRPPLGVAATAPCDLRLVRTCAYGVCERQFGKILRGCHCNPRTQAILAPAVRQGIVGALQVAIHAGSGGCLQVGQQKNAGRGSEKPILSHVIPTASGTRRPPGLERTVTTWWPHGCAEFCEQPIFPPEAFWPPPDRMHAGGRWVRSRHTGHSDLKGRTWPLSAETCLVCREFAAYPWRQLRGSPPAHRPMRGPFSSAL